MAWETGTNAPFSQNPDYKSSSMGVAGIAAVFAFSWAFSWSFGPVSWIYQSEVRIRHASRTVLKSFQIFPMNMRALGTSVSTASNWLNNVLWRSSTCPDIR